MKSNFVVLAWVGRIGDPLARPFCASPRTELDIESLRLLPPDWLEHTFLTFASNFGNPYMHGNQTLHFSAAERLALVKISLLTEAPFLEKIAEKAKTLDEFLELTGLLILSQEEWPGAVKIAKFNEKNKIAESKEEADSARRDEAKAKLAIQKDALDYSEPDTMNNDKMRRIAPLYQDFAYLIQCEAAGITPSQFKLTSGLKLSLVKVKLAQEIERRRKKAVAERWWQSREPNLIARLKRELGAAQSQTLP